MSLQVLSKRVNGKITPYFSSGTAGLSNPFFGLSGKLLYLTVDNVSGTVSSWADASGNGTSVTVVGSPAVVASAINARPAVRFDGSTQLINTGLSLPYASIPNLTMVSVHLVRSVSAAFTVWSTDGENGGWLRAHLHSQTSGNFILQTGSGTDYVPSFGAGVGTPRIVLTQYSSSGIMARVNGSQQSTGTVNSVNTTNTLRICAGYRSEGKAPIDLAEFVVFNRVLTAAEIATVESYFSAKYRIALA